MGDSSDHSSDVPLDESVSLRDAQIALMGRDFSNYAHDGNFAVYFKLVHNRKEAEEDIREGTFYPDFVHQFFIDKERIFGYKKPVIRLFYSASRLKRYVNFDYEDKLSKEKDGIEADDVMSQLREVLDDMEYTRDLNQFINEIESKEEADFKPPGDLLHEFTVDYKKPKILSRAQLEQLEMAGEGARNGGGPSTSGSNGPSTSSNGVFKTQNGTAQPSASSSGSGSGSGSSSTPTCVKKFQIFHANSTTPGLAKFQARMQSLIMWFIESANMIDHEDVKWDFFMVFEKYNPSTDENPDAISVSTEDRFYFAGYATVYRYYAYPDKIRPRVSQMLLLPPYRRNGLGTTLLQSIYDFYKKQPATLDITAEDPDEDFIAMRDLLDCKNCMKLSTFQPEKLMEGWSEEIAKEAQSELKLCQRQARKVYEILKLRAIDKSDEEQYRKYRLEIKNRLNIPNQRLKLDCDKVEKLGYELPEEVKARKDNQKLNVETLKENYQELEKQYQHTIDKLINR